MISTVEVLPGEKRVSRRAPDVVAILLLAGLPFLFFWRLFESTPSSRVFLAWGDLGAQYFPLRLFAARQIADGTLPLWNPFLNAGQPALADSQSAVLYPPNLLLALLTPHGELTLASMQWYVVAHFVLVAIFTYLFARRLLRRLPGMIPVWSAAMAAITFTFGGYLTSFPVQQLSILEAGIWLPLILLLLDIAIGRNSIRLFALSSLPVSMSWLAGHSQTTMYCLYLAVGYLLAKSWTGRGIALFCQRVAKGLGATVAGTALAAVQLLPTYEFFTRSTRLDLGYSETSFGLPLSELFGMLLPGVLGGRTLYIGVLGLTLAIVAILVVRANRHDLFWPFAALASFLVALGGNTFLYSVLFLLVPGFAEVRDQERAVMVVSFCLSIIVGLGAGELLARPNGQQELLRRLPRWLAVCAVTLLLLAFVGSSVRQLLSADASKLDGFASAALFASVMLAFTATLLWLREHVSTRALAMTVLVLAIFDLFSISWQANTVAQNTTETFASNAATAALQKLARANPQARVSSEGLLPGGGSASAVYGFSDIVGNTPFQLRSFAAANKKLDELQRSRLFGVRYWVTKRDLHDGRLVPVDTQGDIHIYELSASQRIGRAYIVHEAQVAEDEDDALRRVQNADLSRTAVLAASADSAAALPQLAVSSVTEANPAFLEDQATRQLIAVDLASPGLLVMSTINYPGWQAFLDGTPVPLLRAQYLLQAVSVPAGKHVIEFRFAPASLHLGLAMSIAAAALLAVAVALSSIFSTRSGQQAPV